MLTLRKAAKKLGRRLKELRTEKGLSQESFALQAGLGRAYYWRLESGQINVTLETLVRIAGALDIELHDLFVVR